PRPTPERTVYMGYAPGPTPERALEAGELDMARAIAIVDGLFGGLEAMHAVHIAHLDIKPPNVVLREGSGEAALVDFGLAGRHIRIGCGGAHYGTAEAWPEGREHDDALGADWYPASWDAARR